MNYLERQQLETDIVRLTNDKADLLTRLQCCEEDLKRANECESMHMFNVVECLLMLIVSIMREEAVSGMMAAAGRKDTGVEMTIRQKSVSDIAIQTTTEERLVPLPVSGANG